MPGSTHPPAAIHPAVTGRSIDWWRNIDRRRINMWQVINRRPVTPRIDAPTTPTIAPARHFLYERPVFDRWAEFSQRTDDTANAGEDMPCTMIAIRAGKSQRIQILLLFHHNGRKGGRRDVWN